MLNVKSNSITIEKSIYNDTNILKLLILLSIILLFIITGIQYSQKILFGLSFKISTKLI